MAPAVLNRTVNQTASFGYQDGTAGSLFVGSRTTRRNSQGDSDWSNNAGPACVLWRLTFDAVTGTKEGRGSRNGAVVPARKEMMNSM